MPNLTKKLINTTWQAFLSFQQQPEPFLVGVVNMVSSPGLSLEDAMRGVAQQLARTENHEGAWAASSPPVFLKTRFGEFFHFGLLIEETALSSEVRSCPPSSSSAGGAGGRVGSSTQ
jgi:hypothetical protein